MPSTPKKKRRPFITRRAQIVMVTCFALAAVLLVTAAFMDRQAPNDEARAEAASFTPAPMPTSEPNAPAPPSIQFAVERMSDTGRPFTVAVLRDFTGSDAVSWVTLMGERVGVEYDRTVILHPWSEGTEPPGYQEPRELHASSNAPLTIFNGSAPSRNAQYSHDNLVNMIPDVAPNLVFISHGHNQRPGTLTEQVAPLVTDLIKLYPDATIVPIYQNPQVPGSPHAAVHQQLLATLRLYVGRMNLPSIDVESGYVESGPFADRYKDNVHPEGVEGYQL